MANFSKRVTSSGETTYQAKCRRQGLPSLTRTFRNRADAKKWAREVERAYDLGDVDTLTS